MGRTLRWPGEAEPDVGVRVNSAASESSLQLALETQGGAKERDEYVKALSRITLGHNDVIGYALRLTEKLTSADVYASSGLFKKLWRNC